MNTFTKHGKRLLTAAVLTAASIITLLGTAGPAHAAGLDWQVTNYDNDGTKGVYLRNSSDLNNVSRDAAHYLLYGTTIHLQCATSGTAVGSHANTAWDYVTVTSGPNAGRAGYLSEHWINTPVGTNQHVSGEPTCGVTPPPGPSAAATKAINWAESHKGQNFESGECLLFVEQAYSAGGINIGTGGTAARVGRPVPRGYARHGDTSPAVGALVFWGAYKSNSAGHVGIYIGNGTVISTSSWGPNGTVVHEWSLAGRNAAGYPYLGWMAVS